MQRRLADQAALRLDECSNTTREFVFRLYSHTNRTVRAVSRGARLCTLNDSETYPSLRRPFGVQNAVLRIAAWALTSANTYIFTSDACPTTVKAVSVYTLHKFELASLA